MGLGIFNLPKPEKGLNSLISLVAWELWKHRKFCVFLGRLSKYPAGSPKCKRGVWTMVFGWYSKPLHVGLLRFSVLSQGELFCLTVSCCLCLGVCDVGWDLWLGLLTSPL